jgi:hypothetical protein
MPLVRFTVNLQRHTTCPSCEVSGATVAEAFRVVFTEHPQLRGYVLDEHGALRHHMAVFVDGRQISDRCGLSDTVGAASEIYVAQALSGGAGNAPSDDLPPPDATISSKRPPNRRGEGPSYRAARLIQSGQASLEEATAREGVTPESVQRALRGRRVG